MFVHLEQIMKLHHIFERKMAIEISCILFILLVFTQQARAGSLPFREPHIPLSSAVLQLECVSGPRSGSGAAASTSRVELHVLLHVLQAVHTSSRERGVRASARRRRSSCASSPSVRPCVRHSRARPSPIPSPAASRTIIG